MEAILQHRLACSSVAVGKCSATRSIRDTYWQYNRVADEALYLKLGLSR